MQGVSDVGDQYELGVIETLTFLSTIQDNSAEGKNMTIMRKHNNKINNKQHNAANASTLDQYKYLFISKFGLYTMEMYIVIGSVWQDNVYHGFCRANS